MLKDTSALQHATIYKLAKQISITKQANEYYLQKPQITLHASSKLHNITKTCVDCMRLQISLLQTQALTRGFGHNLRPFFEMLNDCA